MQKMGRCLLRLGHLRRVQRDAGCGEENLEKEEGQVRRAGRMGRKGRLDYTVVLPSLLLFRCSLHCIFKFTINSDDSDAFHAATCSLPGTCMSNWASWVLGDTQGSHFFADKLKEICTIWYKLMVSPTNEILKIKFWIYLWDLSTLLTRLARINIVKNNKTEFVDLYVHRLHN